MMQKISKRYLQKTRLIIQSLSNMKYLKHLSGFYDKVLNDKINPTHISLYMAIFQYWSLQRFNNPIWITRSELMLTSKIASKVTYHKCIKELNKLGYIKYEPSYNPFKGSSVTVINLEPTSLKKKK